MYNFESHKFYDVNTGLYYLNSRYYNPEVGRFINADGLLGETGNIQSKNMYAYCANNPVMYVDASGFKWNMFEILGAVALVVAIVATVAIVVTCPASMALLAVAGNASASGIGQVISNITNGNPIMQNVLGATVGGGISGLSYIGSGFATDGVGGFANAGINEWENSYRTNDEFDLVDFGYESILYSGLNILTHTPQNATLNKNLSGINLTAYVMTGGYTVSDGGVKDYVTDFIDEIINDLRTINE